MSRPQGTFCADHNSLSTAGLIVMMAVWTAGTATPSDAASATARVVVLHVTNFAQVAVGDLAEAEQVAAHVYAEAGVRAVWTEGTAWNAQPDGAFHADVLLLSKEMVTLKSQLDGLGAHVFGSAMPLIRRAYIFENRIADHARMTDADFAPLLGMVIAHEVGHLLLPAASHSAAGIMCAQWGRRTANLLTFTRDQGRTIRQRLAARSAN